MDATKIVVEFKDVTVRYPNGVIALDGITLDIHSGDLVGLIGPNGSGKSTLLNVILGLVNPTSGTVLLFGAPVSCENLRRIGYVSQKAQPKDANFPSTVFETVLMGRISKAGLFHRLGREDQKKVEEILTLLNLEDLRNRKIGHLSGGQVQRVFVAKALVSDPELLILDEPASGVDTASETAFYELLEHLNKQLGITVILSSHDVGIVSKLASKVVCINRSLFFCGLHDEFKGSSVLPKMYGYPVEMMQHHDHS